MEEFSNEKEIDQYGNGDYMSVIDDNNRRSSQLQP